MSIDGGDALPRRGLEVRMVHRGHNVRTAHRVRVFDVFSRQPVQVVVGGVTPENVGVPRSPCDDLNLLPGHQAPALRGRQAHAVDVVVVNVVMALALALAVAMVLGVPLLTLMIHMDLMMGLMMALVHMTVLPVPHPHTGSSRPQATAHAEPAHLVQENRRAPTAAAAIAGGGVAGVLVVVVARPAVVGA